MNACRWSMVTATCLALAGCGYHLPPGYVKVEPSRGWRFRAVSAEGAAFTLRTEENPENGDLAFWEKAIKNKLVKVRGYKLADRRETTLKDQTPGVELVFDYSRDGSDYTYSVALFVKGRRVHVFEAAGAKDQMTTDLPEIRSAISQWAGL